MNATTFNHSVVLQMVVYDPDIFECATFSFRIRLPSTRIRRIRQRIRKKINPLSRVEKNKSATNPITCGRANPDIFESDDVKSVSSLSPNNKPEIFANHFELGCETRLGDLFHFVWKILFNVHYVLWCRKLGSLRNHDGDTEENVD